MIRTVPLNCSLSGFVVESHGSKSASSRSASIVCCSVSRRNSYIPKLEPFSRNLIDRALKEPPLIQKTENLISDYCLTLEGDDCYNCWRAYLDLKDLEEEVPKREIERMITTADGIKSLISIIRNVAPIYKAKKEHHDSPKQMKLENTEDHLCPIPDGLPKTQEELEEEEKARMPDSPFTRMLRVMARRRQPTWDSPALEHEMG